MNDIRMHMDDLWTHRNDIQMNTSTYKWHTYIWHASGIRVHTTDTRMTYKLHTNDLRMT